MKIVLLSAIGLILIGQLLLGVAPRTILSVAAILFVYFLGFNILEASQPSLVSKLAPGTRKGAAAGVYNTTQSIGLALGGVVGGWLLKVDGQSAVFFHLLWAGVLLAYNRRTDEIAAAQERVTELTRRRAEARFWSRACRP